MLLMNLETSDPIKSHKIPKNQLFYWFCILNTIILVLFLILQTKVEVNQINPTPLREQNWPIFVY
ncbi:MAG TPA: hypothetical protein DCF68_02170 [Cyanothece sp. UBA12306]|nr:hypothetical protein [Cyanothece sp. UBA12306]